MNHTVGYIYEAEFKNWADSARGVLAEGRKTTRTFNR